MATIKLTSKENDLVLYRRRYSKQDDSSVIREGIVQGFPILVLNIEYPEYKEEDGSIVEARTRKYYLSPFRGYGFQVSGTWEGQWDCGSTPVYGLHNLVEAVMLQTNATRSNMSWAGGICKRYNALHHLLRGSIMDCIYEFLDRHVSREHRTLSGEDPSIKIEFDGNHVLMEGDMIDRFVTTVVVYLLSEEHREFLIGEEEKEFYNHLSLLDQNQENYFKDGVYSMDYLEAVC